MSEDPHAPPSHGSGRPIRSRRSGPVPRPRPEASEPASADPGAGAIAAHRAAAAEAQRRNTERHSVAQRQSQLEAHTWRAIERLAELLEHEDPQVALAAAHELLERGPALVAPEEAAPARVTAEDVEHEWERRRLQPRIFKGGAEALGG